MARDVIHEVKINGLAGILLLLEQPAGDEVFLKWAFAFGDNRKTTMLTATFPKAHEQALSARLKSAVLSLRPDQSTPANPGADAPFTLAATPKLKLSPGINWTLAYTKDGITMIKSPGDPLFIAAPSLGQMVIGDQRKFADHRLLRTVHTKQLKVKSVDPITIDGLDGFESLAEAEENLSGMPLIVYQAMLFDEGSYILVQGHVGTKLRDDFLPEFKTIARSFRRKKL